MAEQRGKRRQSGRLEPDEIVANVDPAAVEGAQALTGYLGSGVEGGRWRLYASPTLEQYVEFSEDDVVGSQKLDAPGGGSVVWLRQGAAVKQVSSGSVSAQRSFLQGPIAGEAALTGGVLGGGLLGRLTWLRPTRSACIDCTWGGCASWGMCQTWICGPATVACGPIGRGPLGGGPSAEMMRETRDVVTLCLAPRWCGGGGDWFPGPGWDW